MKRYFDGLARELKNLDAGVETSRTIRYVEGIGYTDRDLFLAMLAADGEGLTTEQIKERLEKQGAVFGEDLTAFGEKFQVVDEIMKTKQSTKYSGDYTPYLTLSFLKTYVGKGKDRTVAWKPSIQLHMEVQTPGGGSVSKKMSHKDEVVPYITEKTINGESVYQRFKRGLKTVEMSVEATETLVKTKKLEQKLDA
ncbi:MAG: hypothetical protein FWD89_03490 [Firmicutes bacterium]|nr:hypothetical protein [Bacillota bacterium]MCL2771352.1 hypothetical protein [Bacillota bacterium]